LSENVKIKILSIVLYGFETWPLILREGHRLKVLENKVLRRVFVLKMDEIIGS
jgi:hypothetical protein